MTLKDIRNVLLLVFAALCLNAGAVFAADSQEATPGLSSESGQPLPRFVSLRSDKVYVRSGPALRYPVKWVFQREGLPVEVVQEFDGWRKIRGIDGDEGWIHQSLLSGDRNVVFRDMPAPAPMHAGAALESRVIARVEPQVVAALEKCSGAWCQVEAGGFRGWVERNLLWGIYGSEYLN